MAEYTIMALGFALFIWGFDKAIELDEKYKKFLGWFYMFIGIYVILTA